MKSKVLTIFNFIIFGSIIVIPFFSGVSFLQLFVPYLITFMWFGLIIIIGYSSLLSIFLLITFIVAAIIFLSYFYHHIILMSVFIGFIAAVLMYFSTGMDSNE